MSRPQRELFDGCPATREVVEEHGCPLCGGGPAVHEPEATIASVPADAPFEEWMLNLPRSPV